MQVTRAFFDPAVALIAWLGLISVVLLILTVPRPHTVRQLGVPDHIVVGAVVLAAGLLAYVGTGQAAGALAAIVVAGALCAGLRLSLPRLSAVGVVELALAPMSLICVTPWTYLMLQEQHFPGWSLALVVAGAGLGLACFGFSFAANLATEAMFTHARWRRPTSALSERLGRGAPKVSIHVPCYAEPPEVVIQTLEHLAALRYEHFEVLVCDNNTADEALWRPLQAYCERQNALRSRPLFKFFHVAPLAGAKAGALNFLLKHTARDAEIVAVVDADYLAEPDFLARLTGFFEDEQVGFVQTPHDYRADASPYQQMCYWEYMPANKVGLASINEYDCAYTIGTMCLFRKSAIERAGGWAEWCLTEDSEISIRIRALGYEGIYVNETFGRGLIPETYEDLKKQRFRWTAGPVQQLLAHWRLFMPAFTGNKAAIHGWAKLMEVHRSLSPLVGIVGVVAGAALFGATLWLTVAGVLPQISLPEVFWGAAFLAAVSGLGKLWQRYRLTGCSAPVQILGAEIARLSLALVKMVAAAAPLTGRPLAWRRTPKFAADSSVGRALVSTAPELTIATTLALLTYVPLHFRPEIGGHAAGVAIAACLASSLAFATAPLMAILSEFRLQNESRARKATFDAPACEPALTSFQLAGEVADGFRGAADSFAGGLRGAAEVSLPQRWVEEVRC